MREIALVIAAGLIGFAISEIRWRRAGRMSTHPSSESVSPSRVAVEHSDETDAIVRSALDALSVGVVIAAPTGTVVYRNHAAGGLTGVVHSDVLLDEAVDILIRSAVEGRSGSRVLDLFGPPRRVFSVSAVALDGGGAVAMVDDISERSILDAVRTDFVANISHELKTPVGAIILLAEAICASDDEATVRRLSTKMVAEAERAGRAIDELLELSRIELGGEAVRESVDVASVVDEAVERHRHLCEVSGIGIGVTLPATTVRMIGDRRQIVSALGNLIENAVKYSDAGSTVEVSVAEVGGWVETRVRDHGIGIPNRDLDRIFERFYRVDRARSRETGGTGLGLAIVRHVATNHGGEVTVSSVEGEGSEFVLRLPALVASDRSDSKGTV